MTEVYLFNKSLSMFQNVVAFFRDADGKLFINNIYFYNVRGDHDYLSIMCKDPLPENMGLMMGWNWLDDNSPNILLVPEESIETGVEDFMYSHGLEKSWKDIEYHVIDNFSEIESYFSKHTLGKGGVVAFGIKK